MTDVGWKRTAYFFVGLAIMAPFLATGFFLSQFGDPDRFSGQPSDWGDFGGFFGAALTLSTASASIALAIIATVLLPRRIDREAERLRKNEEIRALKQRYYSDDFYLRIKAPAWECATKWIGWKGEAGDAYRCDVLGGGSAFEQKTFRTINEANDVKFQNHVSERSHYEGISFDANFPKANEHMLLTMWWSFWEELAYALHADLIDKERARGRYAVEYGYWLDFHQQYWIATDFLNGEEVPEAWGSVQPSERLRGRSDALRYLECKLFSEIAEGTFAANRERAMEIAEKCGGKPFASAALPMPDASG